MLMQKPSNADLGTAFLLVFSPQQRAAIYDAVHSRGPALETDIIDAAKQLGLSQAPLDFINTQYLSADDVMSLLVGLKAVVRDALLADWTVDQYAMAIGRAAKVPSDLAQSMAKGIVTEDSEISGFARSLASWFPDIPLIPFDDAARGLLAVAPAVLTALIPKDALSKSVDTAFEWLQLGEAIRRMIKREALTNSEEAFEKNLSTAVATNPALAPSLLSLATSLAHLPGEISKRLESGDLDAETGDMIGDYLSGLSVLSARPEEQGDLIESPEVGSLFGKIARTVGKIGGGIAGSFIGNPGLGASIGGGLGKAVGRIGGRRGKHHGASPVVQLKRIADDKGYSASSFNTAQVADLLRAFAGR